MIFNSYIFILLFLPLALAGYFICNRYFSGKFEQGGLLWLLGVSLLFYAWNLPVFLCLFLPGIAVNYGISRIITGLKHRTSPCKLQQKYWMTTAVIINLLPLLYFKYSGFIADSLEGFFRTDWKISVAQPLGISFYTFLQIAYIVDCYRDEKGFDHTFLEYAVYTSFFPKITMGPIVLHSEIIPQLRDQAKKTPDYNNLSQGLYAFALGLAKKILLADTLAKLVNAGFDTVSELNSLTAIIVALSYTLQLYFDFSGYCDMAVGISRMLNIELPFNFNSPYKAKSISEFWDRWHMTLTRFFTRYVYIPLGGSRKGKLRTYLNTLIVFLLSGLWHGAAWNFVFWGLLHGIFMIIEKISKDLNPGFRKLSGIPRRLLNCVKWLYTFAAVNIMWIFFRAADLDQAKLFLSRIFSGGWHCKESLVSIFNDLIEIRMLKRLGLRPLLEASVDGTLCIFLGILVFSVIFPKNTQEKMLSGKYDWKRSIVTMLLIIWCVISLSDVSVFLYSNF